MDTDAVKRFFMEKDRFAAHLGIEVLDVTPGTARVRMPLTIEHTNGLAIGHGGAIFSLADLAFAVASNSHGTVAVAINADISYVKAATGDMLFAEARETSRNPRLATYTVEVTDRSGDLVALFRGMVYRKKERMAFG